MDGSATCSIELVRQNNIRHCQNMSVLNTWNTLPRNNRRVLHGIVCSRFSLLNSKDDHALQISSITMLGLHTRRLRPRPIASTLLTFTALRPELRHEIPVVRPSLREKTSLTSLSIS